jgi:tetratricopeptide (TPR) repeat protein
MDSSKMTLITILRDRVGELCEEGNYSEALHAANAAVAKAEQELSPDLDSMEVFSLALEVRGDLYRQIGEPESARDDYRQAIDQLNNRLDRCMQLGRLHADLGAVHDELDNAERAIHHWEVAISFFEKTTPPSSLDIAALSNNLAYLKKLTGDLDGAENALLKALEILHRELGAHHDETACVCNNLGALYHQSGHHEQAREMHLMALEARRKLYGETHPDTAQSYNNLALALSETGDPELAKDHFECAINALSQCGPEAQDELLSISENYVEFLRGGGADDHIDHVEKRVQATIAQWA